MRTIVSRSSGRSKPEIDDSMSGPATAANSGVAVSSRLPLFTFRRPALGALIPYASLWDRISTSTRPPYDIRARRTLPSWKPETSQANGAPTRTGVTRWS